jgi:PadR family transcriptional regulator AphA
MSIEYAILGLLDWRPMSGYDIKKNFSEPTALYWSDNNNLIYGALIDLHKKDMVSCKIHYQEERPPRKVYSITAKGADALQQWLRSDPLLPSIKHPFLIQIAWAGGMDLAEIERLLEAYEEEIAMHLLIYRTKVARGQESPHRSTREIYLWEQIHANRISYFENELNWVRTTRQGLGAS